MWIDAMCCRGAGAASSKFEVAKAHEARFDRASSRRLHPSSPTRRKRLACNYLIGVGENSRRERSLENHRVSSIDTKSSSVCPTIGLRVAVAASKPTLTHMQLMLSPDTWG